VGRFPDARYVSVQVYTPGGVGSSLPDYRIAPQPRSLNPWQQHAAPGGRFKVTIAPDPAPGRANTLPLPAGTTSQHTGYLAYRVYLPAGGAPSDVPLPVLTVEQGGPARTLPACPNHNAPVHFPAVSGSAAPAAGGSGAAAPAPPQLEFFKPPQSTFNNAGLANVDTSVMGPVLSAHGGLPAGDPHRPRPAGMPTVSKVGGMRYIISIGDRTDTAGDAMLRTYGQAGGARWGQEAGGSERRLCGV
jgi:hypothetical protein